MKLVSTLAATALLASCVPSTDDLDPRGAAGFLMNPSAATRGEPFDTADGYRITIDRLVLLLDVQADPVPGDYSNVDSTLVDVNGTAPAYCPAVVVGEARVSARLAQLVVGETYDDPRVDLGTWQYLSRFRQQADLRLEQSDYYEDMFAYGPSIFVAFHAEGHGKRYSVELTLESVLGSSSLTYELMTVGADQLATTPLGIRAEELFIEASNDDCLGFGCDDDCKTTCLNACIGAESDVQLCEEACNETCSSIRPRSKDPLFEPFARRDSNGDGILTAAELNTPDPVEDDNPAPPGVLGKDLLSRTMKLIAPLRMDRFDGP